MLLIGGENLVASREYLSQIKDKAKAKGRTVLTLDSKAGVSQLKEALGADLFGVESLVVIESLLKSKNQELKKYLEESPSEGVVLWEEGKVSKAQVGKLKLTSQEFPVKKELFNFLALILPGGQRAFLPLWERLVKEEAVELIWFMWLRQLRGLMEVADGGGVGQPEWLRGKLLRQAKTFGLVRLLELHKKSYEIEKRVKTGEGVMTLGEEMEMLWLKL